MMYQATIRKDHVCAVSDAVLILAAEKTLGSERAEPGAVTLVLTGDDNLRDLNRRFANFDRATDVLAFPDGSLDPDTGETYYGDVIIAVPIAETQAKQASHPLESELALLIVHGILHLLGHDHSTADELERMEARQTAILVELGHAVNRDDSNRNNKTLRSNSRAAAFRNAFRGWRYVLRTQSNAWIHTAATIAVVALGIWLQLEPRDWALLLFAIGLVWFAEFLNTSFEVLVDLASPEPHPLAQIGKDVGAAAVLITALTAILIGLLVLGPPLLRKFPSP